MHFVEGSFHGDEDGKNSKNCSYSQEVRSWHVHRISNSHIYVQIDFC